MGKNSDNVKLAKRIRGILIRVILPALIVSLLCVFSIQTYVEKRYAYELLEKYVEDLFKDSIDTFKEYVHEYMSEAETDADLADGVPDEQYLESVTNWLMKTVKNRRVGVLGDFVIVNADDKKIIGSTDNIYSGEYIDIPKVYSDRFGEFTRSEAKILGEECYVVSVFTGDHYILLPGSSLQTG